MSPLPETILLKTEEEAVRLWEGAQDALGRAPDSLVALCEALNLGMRAVEVLTIQKLQAVADQFAKTIGMQLETPDPAIHLKRDASELPKSLEFIEVLDLLSEEGLASVSPGLYSGWEDRRFACERARKVAQGVIEFSLDGAERDKLLLLTACRNRIFRLPPPVQIAPKQILDAYPALQSLYARLKG